MSALKDFMQDQRGREVKKRSEAMASTDESILSTLDLIAATPGLNDKKALLAEFMDSAPICKRVVALAYDPFKTYGIRPDRSWFDKDEPGDSMTLHGAIGLLDPLMDRTLTGNAAKEEVQHAFQALSPAGREVFYRVLDRDLRAGFGETMIRKIDPSIYPRFEPMLAKEYDPDKIKTWPVRAEYKLDGYRCLFVCREDVGGFYTRSGQRITALDFRVDMMTGALRQLCAYAGLNSRRPPDEDTGRTSMDVSIDSFIAGTFIDRKGRLNIVLDGEAMMGIFAQMGALRSDADAPLAEFHVHDVMPVHVFDGIHKGDKASSRRLVLNRLFDDLRLLSREDAPESDNGHYVTEAAGFLFKITQFFAHDDAAVQRLFQRARTTTVARYLARGDEAREAELLKTTIDKATGQPKLMEGLMVKDPDGLYEGKRSAAWMKMKGCEADEFPIVGAFPGTPGTKYEGQLGGFVISVDGVQVRIGSGFSDEDRVTLWKAFNDDLARIDKSLLVLEGDAILFKGLLVPGLEVVAGAQIIGVLAEVEYHEKTPDGSLRHPRMIRLRHDKRAA